MDIGHADNRFELDEKKFIMDHMSAREWDLSYSGTHVYNETPFTSIAIPNLLTKLNSSSFIKYLTVTLPTNDTALHEIRNQLIEQFPSLHCLHYYRRENHGPDKLTTHYLYLEVSKFITCLFYIST